MWLNATRSYYHDKQLQNPIDANVSCVFSSAHDDTALQCLFSSLRKENEDLRARIERLEAMIAARPQTDTKPNPAPIIADIEISKESLKQARADIIKAIQF